MTAAATLRFLDVVVDATLIALIQQHFTWSFTILDIHEQREGRAASSDDQQNSQQKS
jgi:hypothetical protein